MNGTGHSTSTEIQGMNGTGQSHLRLDLAASSSSTVPYSGRNGATPVLPQLE